MAEKAPPMPGNSTIFVTHEVQMAHRLMNLPGKCQNIHGHSMKFELVIGGELNDHGILADLDFGTVKEYFREYLNTTLDHKLALSEQDPWAWTVIMRDGPRPSDDVSMALPGVVRWPGDPTTENLAKWVAEEMWRHFYVNAGHKIDYIKVTVVETSTNGAEYMIP